MCEPFDRKDSREKDLILNAMFECISAQSALNMPPAPNGFMHEDPTDMVYLSECDDWAKHSMVHLHAAHKLLSRANTYQEKLITAITYLATLLCENGVEFNKDVVNKLLGYEKELEKF